MLSTHRLIQLVSLQDSLRIKLNSQLTAARKQQQRNLYKSSKHRFHLAAKTERVLSKVSARLANG